MPPPPAAARRANSTNSPTMSSTGPKPSSSDRKTDWLVDVDCALMTTFLEASRLASCGLFQNVGTSVANSVVGVADLSFAG